MRGFIPNRIVSADNLARQIARQPGIYEKARDCPPAPEATLRDSGW